MVEPAEFRLFVLSGKMKFSEWYKNWRSTDFYFFYQKQDPWPFYSIFTNGIKSKIKSLFGR